jgi:hypothetical protein
MTECISGASNTDPTTDSAWLDGYKAALTDAIAMVDALGGPSFQNLSAPVLLRMKSRLIELQGRLLAA